VIAGLALAFMLLITLSEVILRSFGRPILGSYEIISFTGGIIIGLAIPYTSWKRGHVYVDFLINKFSKKRRRVIMIITRCLGILLFLLIGWNLISMGSDLYMNKEVSMTLRLPFYPIAYCMGISCLIQCILLFSEILKIRGGEYD
jgi:TRAP-type C4-dicarboxylate transport system permease small subunit